MGTLPTADAEQRTQPTHSGTGEASQTHHVRREVPPPSAERIHL